MAIAFDAAISTSSAANVASLTTGAMTISGSNRIVVGGACSGAGTPVNPTAVKWGGSSGTDLTQRGATLNIGSFGKAGQWSLVAPATGSATGYVSWGSNQDETAVGFTSYTDVDQTTPHGTQATNTGTTDKLPTVDVTSAVGELVTDVCWHVNQAGDTTGITAGAGQTSRVEIDQVGGSSFESLIMSEEAGAATVTMSHTIAATASGVDWGILGIPLKPAGAVANTRVYRLPLMGAG